jgi:ParB family chromosome partitioning protein
MKEELYSESIYFVEVGKIEPNPYQPRREFDQARLRELSESIRQYGVLQPLVVSRLEEEDEHGGMLVRYELIAGERRLRASKLAGLEQVPAVIRKDSNPMMKLELAIIENLQREDLNPVDRARAFMRLHQEFGFSHKDIGKKVGKSRVYVSNSLRILQMPEEILVAVEQGRISEGHTRPLLMLGDRPDEQTVLFKEILYKKITVREAERIARSIAKDKARKKELLQDPKLEVIEKEFQNTLGTRVYIKKRDKGGNITIDFFSDDDLDYILDVLKGKQAPAGNPTMLMEKYAHENPEVAAHLAPPKNRLVDPVDRLVNAVAGAKKIEEQNSMTVDEVLKADPVKEESSEITAELDQETSAVEQNQTPMQDTVPAFQNAHGFNPVSELAQASVTETESAYEPVPVELLTPRPLVEHEIIGEQAQNIHLEVENTFEDASNDLETNAEFLDDSSNEDLRSFEIEEIGKPDDSKDEDDLYNISNFSL